tara:strand:- start:169 stop:480 length:312 start_codon:yes stop_codon:yes gene_type:complete
MKQTVNENDFHNAFFLARPDQFSYEARSCLFEFYTGLEESTGMEEELDVIAICCGWAEYESFDHLYHEYSDYCVREGIETMADFAEHTHLYHLSNGGILIYSI